METPIQISGAGLSGLAAALTIAKSGRPVIVHEHNSEVGSRFHGDFQGLENWTTKEDVLEELQSIGISLGFEHAAYRDLSVFDPEGNEHAFRSSEPLFYLVRRGAQPGTLDESPKEKEYLARTVKFFTEKTGVQMESPRRFGGVRNFMVPRTARKARTLYAGEAAGFQDALWGFGMRYAMLSGHLAAQAALDGSPEKYDSLWQGRLGGQLRASIMNRYVYKRLGNSGYTELLRHAREHADPRAWLRDHYAEGWWKSLLFPVARRAVRTSRKEAACPMEGCDCTWCRCQHDSKKSLKAVR